MNNTRWHEDFGPAFQILLEHGYPDNHLVQAGQNLSILLSPMVSTPTQPTPSFAAHAEAASNIVLVTAISSVVLHLYYTIIVA